MIDGRKIKPKADVSLVITPPFFVKMPHVGVAYLASFLKQKGYTVRVEDLSLILYQKAPQELKSFWNIDCCNSYFQSEIADKIFQGFESELSVFVESVLSSQAKVIGFSVNIISIYLANRLAKMIKERDPQRLIIFGGAGTYFNHPRDLVKPSFADVYVLGEGEFSLLSIIEDYSLQRKIKPAPGILLNKDLGRFDPGPSSMIPDLDILPFPTYAEFAIDEYNPGDNYKPLPLLLSRGCVNKCSYCIDCIMWPKYRFRSPGQIMEEIEYHVLKNKTKAFELNDLTCNGNLTQLRELCDLIIASKLEFNWVSYAIIRKDMDEVILSKMKKAGCHTIIYGVENGSDRILALMGKRYTAQEASEVIRRTHQAGICTNINIIAGFPGETDEDFSLTVKFIQDNKDYIDEITNVSGCTLFPAADLGRNKEKYGVIWQQGTDPMLFSDSNGTGRQERNVRVSRLVELINELGLTKAIVNKPELNPKVKEIIENEKIN